MTEGTEDLAARLAALEGSTGKAKASKRPAPLAAILGVVGIAAAGGLAWAALQPSAEALPAVFSELPYAPDAG